MGERLPFLPHQESGADVVSGASPIARNVVFDGKGAIRRRPTLGAHSAVPSSVVDAGGIEGLHVTSGLDILAVGAPSPVAKIYQLNSTTARDLSPTAPQGVAGGRRPIFAETEALLVIAAGAEIQKVVLVDMISSRLGGTPPRATHVIANNSRLLCNTIDDNLNLITYSGLAAGLSYAGHEDWLSSATGTVSIDARPGPVVALWENMDEVVAFGDSNVEMLRRDGLDIYVRTTARENGCIAPYSVARVDAGFAWLDHSRRFVLSDGRSTKILSAPAIQQNLADMADPSDCFGYRVQIGALDCLVWSFASDARAFVHSGDGWSQWSGVDNSRFKATCFAQYLGDTLVGTSDGRVGALDADGYADFGETVTAYIETGFVSHGTAARKHCRSINVFLRRGHGTGGELLLSWRDDLGPWNAPLTVTLGSGSDRDLVFSFRSLGTYRARQWRATFSGTESFLLVGVEENFTVAKE